MSFRALLFYVSVYRPVMERTLLAVSLTGIVLVMHLGLQLTTGFPNGCFGLTVVPGALASCSRLIHGGAPFLAGFPVAPVMAGALALIAAATIVFFAVAYLWPNAARWAGLVRLVLLSATGGLTVYYTATAAARPGGIGGLATVFLLAVGVMLLLAIASTLVSPRTHVALMTTESLSSRMFRRETALYLYLVALTVVLVGADFAAYDALSSRSVTPTSTAAGAGAVAADRAAPVSSSVRSVRLAAAQPALTNNASAACGYDDSKGAVQQFASLVGMEDPAAGSASAPVTVVEFFDPNCPHCATFHSEMKELIETHGEKAHFVFKPIPLGQMSVNQIEALYAANRAGSFNAMLEAQYDQQQRGGLSNADLKQIANEIGMDGSDVVSAIEEDRFMGTIRLVYQQAQRIGVNSTPTVLINGRFVTPQSRTADCLATLIDEAS